MHKLHGVLLGVSVLPALLIMPVMAAAPDTENTVFVFGDVTFDNQHVANGEAAFGGRRMDNWSGGKYQNDFPRYKMLGRSMAMSNSDAYIGPVELTMGDLGDAAFAFNYQINEVDVNLAELAGVTWNQDYDTVFDNVKEIIGEGNAGYTAGPVYAMAIRDDSKAEGSLSFSNSTVMVDGSTIDANTISITNGSELTFVKQDHSKLGAFLEGVIDSDGNTTLTADTITVDASQFNVNSGAALNITTTDTETGTTFSNLSTTTGALSVIDGSAHISGNTLVFDSNTSSSHGAGLYYKETTTGLDSSVVLDAENITFSNNTSNYSASSGGAVFNSGGDVSILGDTNTFTGNQIQGTDVDEKLFKRGGGAIANQSYETEAPSNKQPLDATMVIGTANSVNTFTGNTSSMNGGAIMNRSVDTDGDATLTINGATTFSGNTAALNGGAIYNIGMGEEIQVNGDWVLRRRNTLTLNGSSTFDDNHSGGKGGAIYNAGDMTINGATFTSNSVTGNTWEAMGGAIYNTGSDEVNWSDFTVNGILTINNSTFGDKNDATKGNTAVAGGAVAMNDDLGFYHGQITLNNTNFYGNKALSAADSGESALGGAIYNLSGTVIANGAAEFEGNKAEGYAAQGGAVFNSDIMTFNDAVTFTSNTVEDTNGANGGMGGAIMNSYSSTMTFNDFATFTGNEAMGAGATRGGAVYNGDELTFANGALFTGNKAKYGAAVYNEGTLSLTDASFSDNIAASSGGAIYNEDGVVNVSAVNSDVVFSGNFANNQANDIFNTGTVNFNAAAGKSISLEGILGSGGTINKTGAGTLNISEYIAFQDVYVNAGELHLTTGEGNLYQSTVDVASGATLNSIDNLVNNYVGKITLNDGALFGLDVDFNNNLFDTYTIADAATVTLSKVNLLSALTGNVEAKDLRIAELGNINISSAAADSVKAYTSTAVFGLVGNDENNGTISLAQIDTVASGTGLSLAAADSVNQEQSYYQVTADESVTTDQNLVNEFAVVGSGTTDGDAGVALDATFAVADDSTFTAENIKLEGTGSIDTAADAEFAATNAKVGVDVNNEGTTTFTGTTFTVGNTFTNAVGATATMMNSDVYGTFLNSGIVYSDPTTYYGLFDNAGTATFEGDTFETAAVLNNTGVANFAKDGDDNEVTFVSGATITGDGLINLLSGTTHFNNTASSNTIKLANGAMFDGTLASTGVLDTRNGNIDTGLGTVTGGDLYVDANLVAGTTDAFANTTGATIRGISLANAGYGTSDSVTVDFGGATLDANAEIDGMNYYTQITQSGSSVTFSDKLINESNLYSKLGSWTGGYYIKSNVDMTNAADADHLTVGQALQALDTAVNGKQAAIVDSATIAANGTGGFDVVAGSIGATQLAANSVASSNIIDGTIVNADIATGTITTDRLANQGVAQFTNDANYQNADQVSNAITTALANGTNAYQTASDVTTTLGAYSTTAQMNAAIATATTMGDDGDAGTSMYNNFADGVSVTSAVASLDAAIGTTTTGTHVVATNSVGQNLNALDTALATVESNITAANTAIATATTMNDDSDPSTSLYSHFADGASVKDAVTNIDTALAAVEGTIGTTTNGTHVLAANSIGTNINALDTALVAAEGTISTHTAAIGTTTDGTHVLAANSIGTNLNALDTALATAEGNITANATAIATLNGAEDVAGSVRNIAKAYAAAEVQGAYSYADKLVDNLNEDLSAGIASAVALSSVAVSDVRRGEMSVGAGYGYFNGQSAAAFGAAMGISNRWSVNAGAGVSGYDVSFRAGTNYKFKLF